MEKNKNDLLNETEIHNLRAFIGHFKWLATQARSDILFQCCDVLGKITNTTIDDSKGGNKLVKKIKNEEIVMTLKKEGNLAGSKLLPFCNVSFARMSGGGYQGGYVIFWSYAFGNNI